jgi:hypothetical protein
VNREERIPRICVVSSEAGVDFDDFLEPYLWVSYE